MSILAEAVAVVPAIFSGSTWDMRQAFDADGMWLFCFVATLVCGYLAHLFYQFVPFAEKHLERGLSVTMYLIIAGIICWGVIDRFIFSNQQPWSTTIPPLLFMIMAWYGASYNVRVRTHLSFSEFRTRLPRAGQMACLIMDAVLWMVFAIILVVTTSRVVALSAFNFQIVLGTDNTMTWWFLITAPFAFILLSARVWQNLMDDLRAWKNNEPLIKQAVIGGDV